jgi:Zn-dependent M28 family amino/carboxypeptidase
MVTLVHHDAAPSGMVFGQYAERWLADRHPEVVAAMTSNPPMWWPVIAGPALVSVGSLAGRTALRRAGTGLSALAAAALAEVAFRPPVPGANDNLSGVAAALVLAEELNSRPVPGLRMIFVSAGAEEALQQGIRGFAREHFDAFDKERTWFFTLDTVGSGRLVMLEGEGTVRMHDYSPPFKDLVAGCAHDAGITLLRGLRSRNSTDGCVPSHYGFPTVTLVSVDSQKLLPNYHLYSDTPENVDYASVRDTVRLAEAVARRLAAS